MHSRIIYLIIPLHLLQAIDTVWGLVCGGTVKRLIPVGAIATTLADSEKRVADAVRGVFSKDAQQVVDWNTPVPRITRRGAAVKGVQLVGGVADKGVNAVMGLEPLAHDAAVAIKDKVVEKGHEVGHRAAEKLWELGERALEKGKEVGAKAVEKSKEVGHKAVEKGKSKLRRGDKDTKEEVEAEEEAERPVEPEPSPSGAA
mmetsp:Transcript_35851/g.83256  ORF Transcript_35851/g.83256 Transcript_35851/m.83256 type:complete len:201 (+) Transcript_35851:300-902(+)